MCIVTFGFFSVEIVSVTLNIRSLCYLKDSTQKPQLLMLMLPAACVSSHMESKKKKRLSVQKYFKNQKKKEELKKLQNRFLPYQRKDEGTYI